MKKSLSVFLFALLFLFSMTTTVSATDVEVCTVGISQFYTDETTTEQEVVTQEDASSTDEESIMSEEDTSASDEESATGEEDTSASDEESTSGEEDTSTSDEESTSGEEDTSTSDEESTSGEEDTSASDEESTSGEEDTSTSDEESTSGEEDTSASDEESTTDLTTEPSTEPTTEEPTTEPVDPGTTGVITVYNSSNDVVKTYNIIIDKPETNTRKNIQKALDYCKKNASVSDIYTVVLPKGEYGIQKTINMYGNTVLDLGGSVIYRIGNCGTMLRFGKNTETFYGYTGFVNVKVKNGVFDGNDTGLTSLMCVAHASNVEVTDVTYRNTTGVAHFLTLAAVDNVKVKNCKFLDMTITDRQKNNNCEAIQIDVLKKEYFAYPAYDGTVAKNIEITNCHFEDVNRGVGTHTAIAGHYFDNIVIKNNTFENITGYAVRTLNYINSEVSGNIINNCGSGILCGTTPNYELVNFFAPMNPTDTIINNLNIKIHNNKMTLIDNGMTSSAYGIKVSGAKINNFRDADGKLFSGDCRISGITVENNSITSSVYAVPFYAIYVDGAFGASYGATSNLVIKNNTVTNTWQGSSNIVYGVRIDNSDNIYLSGNRLTDLKSGTKNMQMGIVATSSNGIYVTGNNISNIRYCAVKLNMVNKARVEKNTISNIYNSSIYVCGSSNNIFLVSNNISDCLESAIYVSGAKVNRVESNTIINCTGHGIYFTTASTGMGVVSNYICNSKKTGINVDSTAYVNTITKNVIDVASASIDGISVLGKSNVKKITYNKINTRKKKPSKAIAVAAKFGIRINSAECKIKQIANNTIRKCSNSGIYIVNAGRKAKVANNNIRTSKYGIQYKKKFAKIGKNNIKKCTKANLKVIKVKKAKKA